MENELELEEKIAVLLGLPLNMLIFNFKSVENIVNLDLITTNPLHQQSFLFHTTKALDKKEALQKMIEYIEVHYPQEDTYTIQWSQSADYKLNTSYFRARNIYGVLEKFYYERDITAYKIYSISLNPVS